LKSIYIIFIISVSVFSSSIFSQTIAVVNIQSVINNNNFYNDILLDIEQKQQKYLISFEAKENDLKLKLKEIESSKLILSEKEINSQIEEYNNQLSDFTILIEEFNTHYQNEVINIREYILKEIINLLENYATKNNVDLILDSNSYLIVSNSLDITEEINNELKQIELKLEYSDFEKN
tara:strand:+ start:844 stop:1377 length:534 start_codon:yes stop_codon:yes gene_type:complete